MTLTAGELVAQLRHVAADTPVFLVTEDQADMQDVRGLSASWPRRAQQAFKRRIVRLRVVPLHNGSQYVFIQGEKL